MHAEINILDIGCGKSKVLGAIGIDFNQNLCADIMHDLNVFPYPFDSSEFDEVHIRSTLFLLDNSVKVMEEIHRICKVDGRVVVVQPYFRSVWSFVDPWVKNFGTAHTFAFYDPDDLICTRYEYSKARFSTERVVFDEHLSSPSLIRKLIIKLANRFPRKHELYLSHLLPLDMITFYLKKL